MSRNILCVCDGKSGLGTLLAAQVWQICQVTSGLDDVEVVLGCLSNPPGTCMPFKRMARLRQLHFFPDRTRCRYVGGLSTLTTELSGGKQLYGYPFYCVLALTERDKEALNKIGVPRYMTWVISEEAPGVSVCLAARHMVELLLFPRS